MCSWTNEQKDKIKKFLDFSKRLFDTRVKNSFSPFFFSLFSFIYFWVCRINCSLFKSKPLSVLIYIFTTCSWLSSLMTNLLTVWITASRRSHKRQQYRNGFMAEFMNIKVVAKFHSSGQGWCEMPWRVNKMYIGR